MFYKLCEFNLRDFEGLSNEHGYKLLANYIKNSGNYITPLHINCYGDVVGVKFADGLIDYSIFIPNEFYKYFSDRTADKMIHDIFRKTFITPTMIASQPLQQTYS